jgi:hypothetical protein
VLSTIAACQLKRLPVSQAALNINQVDKFISMSFHQKQKASYGPLPCGLPTLCGHWLFAYAGENHVRFCGGDYAAEMFFS